MKDKEGEVQTLRLYSVKPHACINMVAMTLRECPLKECAGAYTGSLVTVTIELKAFFKYIYKIRISCCHYTDHLEQVYRLMQTKW